MQIRLLLTFCFLTVYSTTQAALIDSVGVENSDGKKTIIHRVEAHETYYSIGHKYGVNPRSISDFYSKNVLKIGTLLKVPTDFPFEHPVTIPTHSKDSNFTSYTVLTKETLYSIAHRFDMTVEEVKALNNLTSDALLVGQILQVRKTALNTSEKTIYNNQKTALSESTLTTSESELNTTTNPLKLPVSKYGLHETNERGIALLISDDNLDGNQMLALHRTAPIGTVIKITNPMTQKTTFAKVVGKFTENESTKNVIIILTKAVADLVGALDKKFQVNLTYGVPNG